MHPILLKFGFLSIYSYGFAIAIGIFLAILYFQKKAQILKLENKFVENFPFYVIIWGFIGGRLFYIFTNISYYLSNPLSIIKVWEGGFVFYGGLIFGLLFALYYLKRKKIDILKILDIGIPALPLAHIFGRIGCFLAGCCYGKPTDLFCGVVFKNESSIAYPYMVEIQFHKIHPTQIYEAFCNLIIFLILNSRLKNKKMDGEVFFLYLFLYGILRLILEYFRGDDRGYMLFGFALTTLLFFIIGLLSAGYLLYKRIKIKI